MNSKPEPTLKYSVANVVANGWLNIEDDEHPLYWVKGKSILYAHVFNNKLQNWLTLYLEVQKQNSSNRISKLKEMWTDLNLKVVQSIFQLDQLHSHCHLPKEVAESFCNRLNNMKDKYQNYGEDDFYTNNYNTGEVMLG